MPKAFHLLGASFMLATVLSPAWSQAPQQRQGNLRVGDAAPDFALQDVAGKRTVRLSGLKGQPVVLIFGSCT